MKTYPDVIWRVKPTDLSEEDAFFCQTYSKKLTFTWYWVNELLTVAKVNVSAIIVKCKKDRKVFSKTISVVKKNKHISDSDDYLDNNSISSAEINTDDTRFQCILFVKH